jgi:hypothetical protein
MIGVEKIICGCGGFVEEVKTTKTERRLFGCSRDTEENSCCAGAFKCSKCKVRWTIQYESPEME